MPGTLGNAAIAGHRTTYGAPFGEIDKLKAGDEIIIDMPGTGRFVYEVYRPELLAVAHQAQLGSDHLIVGKRDVWVVDATSDAQLTLTSCHPKGSAEQRIVVKAKLVKNKSSKPTKPAPQRPNAGKSLGEGLEQGLSGTHAGLEPTIGWGIVTFVVGIAWWWAFRRWRHPLTWVLGLIPFLGVLAPFYFFLERALPAGY
jgi:sortase A